MLPDDLLPLPLDVSLIPRSSGLLSGLELDLTENYDATALLEILASQKVSALTLLTAFRKRATIAQQCTNCLTELIPGAIEEAKACDDFLTKTGRTKGPLHGLPISLKEQIAVSGLRTNAGFVAWVNSISEDDAQIVKSLRALGAVIFARTTEPQSLMHLETSSNIYGATVHPKNRNMTSGGSSGGEGALMGMKGSPFGIGGDIGGSIRVPAALNGVYGFLPTPGLISGEGVVNPTPGCDAIIGTLGPFARSLRDIKMFCKAYSSICAWIYDRSIIPGEILNPTLGQSLRPTQPLRVGILLDDGVVSPLPPVRRVLEEVKRRLEQSSSIHLKPFIPWDHAKAWRVVSANYFEDTGTDIREKCRAGDEPLKPLTEWILEQCESNTPGKGSSLQKRKADRDAFRASYSAHWNRSDIDVLIAPTTPSTAPQLGTSKYWGYTAVWNLLSYPVITLPAASLVNEVNRKEDLSKELYVPKNDVEAQTYKHYSPETSEGMPVGIQVIAPRLYESVLVEATGIIESALRVGN